VFSSELSIGVYMLKKIIAVVTFVWFLVGGLYAIYNLEFKSIAIAVTGLVAFLSAVSNLNSKSDILRRANHQNIKSGNGSVNIQVGGNYTSNSKGDKT